MFSVIVPRDQEPQTRRSHKKSRGGCRTCKARRMKCDEVKPTCGNCKRRFVELRPCDYSNEPKKIGSSSKPEGTRENDVYSAVAITRDTNHSPLFTHLDLGISLPQSIDGALLDPFRTHPQSVVKGVDFLMKYYLRTAVYTCFPWQPPSDTNPTTTYFVPLVWSDTVLFHAILQLSFIRFQVQCKQKPDIAGSELNAETIRLLRERVEQESDDMRIGVSDQTISAVATLVAIEHERGDLRMMRMHLGGLRRMVGIRGGLNAIRETNPMVANSVFWVFAVAVYEVSYPELDPVLPPFFPGDHGLVSSHISSSFDDIAPGSSDPPSVKYALLGLHRPVALVLNSVQHVSQLVPTQTAYPNASTSLVILTRLCTLLSHLLSLPPIPRGCDSIESQFSNVISECARLAILLHVFTPWRGLPPDGTLAVSHLVHNLIDCLRELLLNPMMKKNILVLWIFAVGGVASIGTPERKWFVSHLGEIAKEMAIESWEGMKACVSQGIWHEALCEKPYHLLWEDIEADRKLLEFA